MFSLVAHFDIELAGRCLIAWPEEEKIVIETKIDNFDISIQFVPGSSSRWKKSNEKYLTKGYDQIVLKVAKDEPEAPPRATPDEHGQIDYAKNDAFYRQRSEEYVAIARCCVDRLTRFFKYRLRNPILLELNPEGSSYSIKQWTDQDGNRLHIGPFILTIKKTPGSFGEFGAKALDPDSFELLKKALTKPVETALYEEVFSDAQRAIIEDNFRRGVMELAIACEIAVKNRFFAGGSPAGAAFEYLEDKSQVRATVLNLIDKIALEAFNRSFRNEQLKNYESIDFLFRCRNKVVHRGELCYRNDKGKKININRAIITQWLDAADALVSWLKELEEKK